MKKILLALIVFIACFGFLLNINVYAEDNEYKVCTDSAGVFSLPKISSEKIKTLSYGQHVTISDESIEDSESGIKFFALIEDGSVSGYVIATTVSKDDGIKYLLQTNAKLNASTKVYSDREGENQLTINSEDVLLEKDTPIKLLENYNINNKISKISFEKDGEIYTGYILTENIFVSGFNYYFLIAIFLIVIIGSTVIPIVYKNWKKQRNQTISTSPQSTSK